VDFDTFPGPEWTYYRSVTVDVSDGLGNDDHDFFGIDHDDVVDHHHGSHGFNDYHGANRHDHDVDDHRDDYDDDHWDDHDHHVAHYLEADQSGVAKNGQCRLRYSAIEGRRLLSPPGGTTDSESHEVDDDVDSAPSVPPQ